MSFMIEIQRRPEVDLTLLPDTIAPLLKRIYIARGIHSVEQLETAARALHSYQKLHGIEAAVTLLFEAIQTDKRIIVVGDFDADGATSSALSVLALRMLGSNNVDYLVPNRFEDGYGLSPDVVDQAIALGAQMIMTVDNGVSSIEGVRYAKQQGLQVLVTDHHLPGHELPAVDAMVNPNLQECAFPSKALAGVGVAFYLMMALCVHMRKHNWFVDKGMAEPKLMELIDLVALGTVADVVPLDENNRILVHQGLQRIRAGKARPGIQALIEVAKRDARRLVASDFGFALGPRINAAGRLDDMSFGVELLMSTNIYAARRMASELDGLNQTRKEIEEGMKQEAMAFCERLQFGEQDMPHGLVLFQRDWHQGVIGIVILSHPQYSTEIELDWFEPDFWQQRQKIVGAKKGRATAWFFKHADLTAVLRHRRSGNCAAPCVCAAGCRGFRPAAAGRQRAVTRACSATPERAAK